MKWINMMMPEGVQINKDTQTDTFAELIVAPLEKGFGHTLGTALRRTLLSSIHGHAITATQMDGVKHELSTMPNVLEDVTDVVLNLKQIVFKLSDVPAHWATIEASEVGEVTAGMLQGHPELEVFNPDHVICTLTEPGNVKIRMYIDMGRGYVEREAHEIPDEVIGVIRMDANYSPLKMVSYRVEDTRVGQRTDYDKLIMSITSDGSVTAEDAVAFASKILKDHFQMFINFDEAPIDAQDDDIDEEQERLIELLGRNVEELELSVRSANCLKAGKILSLYDLVTKTEQEMLKFRNFGRKSLNEITEILDGMDLAFGMSFDGEIAERVTNNGASD